MIKNDASNAKAQVNRITADAASSAKDGIDTASAGAGRALNAAASTLDRARDETAPAIKKGIDQAKGWVDDTTGRVQDGVQTARDKANDVADLVVAYARDEPVKALLIAAAVGAGLMTLIAFISRSDD